MIEQVTSMVASALRLGGPVVAILLTLSVFALALIALKLWQFWREGVARHGRVNGAVGMWQRGQRAEALSMVDGTGGAVDACVALAMKLSMRDIATKQQIEEEIGRVALGRLHDLQRGFRALEAIAHIAPLLGLFGTVLGMIEAFRNLQSAGNSVDPSILAGGIWVALLTTAVGLAVAMPVSLVLTWFETRVEDERVAIETLSASVLNGNLLRVKANQAEATDADPAFAGQAGHAH